MQTPGVMGSDRQDGLQQETPEAQAGRLTCAESRGARDRSVGPIG